jgi:hypothetical protein
LLAPDLKQRDDHIPGISPGELQRSEQDEALDVGLLQIRFVTSMIALRPPGYPSVVRRVIALDGN